MLARLLGNSVKISALYRTPTVRHTLTACRRRHCSRVSFDLYPKAHVIQCAYLQAQVEGRQLTADETLARDLWAAQHGLTKGGFESFKLSIMLDDTSGINTLLKCLRWRRQESKSSCAAPRQQRRCIARINGSYKGMDRLSDNSRQGAAQSARGSQDGG